MAEQQQAQAYEGKWESGLCNCLPCSTCLLATFCPCFVVGSTADRMRDPTMATANVTNNECLEFGILNFLTGCGWICVMRHRTQIRQRYGIAGSETNDCCTSYWCACCAIIQHDNEVKRRTAGQTAPVVEAYKSEPGMAVPGPVTEKK
ncbi:PLAC8 family-domain-containing protein [Cercophora scortea]|uniref:PLAC8 family-domain-containing protein n=1 Tax=Cercophora scortea TaxID=314031 RepID=A0AAE0I7X3_9PEZI|nr:PLAC8 family-domain-containing protein [Cercophora scortea]